MSIVILVFFNDFDLKSFTFYRPAAVGIFLMHLEAKTMYTAYTVSYSQSRAINTTFGCRLEII